MTSHCRADLKCGIEANSYSGLDGAMVLSPAGGCRLQIIPMLKGNRVIGMRCNQKQFWLADPVSYAGKPFADIPTPLATVKELPLSQRWLEVAFAQGTIPSVELRAAIAR